MVNEPITLSDELPLIRASELAQFSFCRRAWWLGVVKGLPSRQQATLERGIHTHRRHADQVQAAVRWRQVSLFLWAGGILLLVVGLLTF